ncbi:diguanylate cyclase domain-containing protein [Deferrisoma camini]|uniref:diguanylate cyclase domain-containing protein n=1 Tax=Deferrisoma camini TaxID=1035120 RepID=UPI00046CE9EC|nr:diguanylate cyclase [Deferrisoma camini]
MAEKVPTGLGVRLILVSAAIVALAALVVGAVVTKLSEDEVKARLRAEASELARIVEEVAGASTAESDLSRVVLRNRLRRAGSAWVLDRQGRVIAAPAAMGDAQDLGGLEVELLAARKPLETLGERGRGNRLRLAEAVGDYEEGIGLATLFGEPRMVAFRVLRDRGWVVAVDEPYASSSSVAASLKKYVLLTCGVLGLSILLSTALSISFVIKPFYRERLDLLARVEAANRNLRKLHEVSVGMQRTLALEDRIRTILGAAHEVLGLDRIFLFLPNPERTVLECKGAFGNQDESPEEIRLPLGPGGGVIAQAFLQKRTYRVENARELPPDLRLQPPYDEIRALRSRSFIVIPMIVESDCVGVVAVDNQISKRPIPPEVIETVELFTSQAAVAIENARLYQQLKLYADELEVTDHLTQLFTFFHFKKLLQGEIDRARLAGTALGLLVVRIDNFAQYNERLGHKHGDEVLRRVAEIIRERSMPKDVIGRCFGSTFAVLMPGADAETARERAADLLAALEEESYPGEEALPEGRLRFAAGWGEYRRAEGANAEEFFAAVNERTKEAQG